MGGYGVSVYVLCPEMEVMMGTPTVANLNTDPDLSMTQVFFCWVNANSDDYKGMP